MTPEHLHYYEELLRYNSRPKVVSMMQKFALTYRGTVAIPKPIQVVTQFEVP